MLHLWEQYKQSSTFIKIAFGLVIAIWLTVLLSLSIGLLLMWEQPSVAQPSTPGADVAIISPQPAAGPVDAPLTIEGQGWAPNSTVLIYLAEANETTLPPYALASVVTDATGQFSLPVTLPSDTGWPMPGTLKIIAQTQDEQVTALAFYGLLAPVAEATVTVTSTVTTAPPISATSTATPVVPTDTPQPGAPQATTVTDLNVRSGPGTDYALLGLLPAGHSAEIIGLSPDRGWWLIKFPVTEGRGWVSAKYVTVQNVSNVPVVQPPARPAPPTAVPTVTPKPVEIKEWRGEYFTNPGLSGSAVLVRNDPTIDFNWGDGSPAAGIGSDNFSVRWSRTLHFPAGPYRFYVQSDDGVRLWVDNNLVIDQWREGGATTYTAEMTLTGGPHSLKMEYYERGGTALARLAWEMLETFPDWKGEYFNNSNLSGAPALVRNDLGVNFSWGPSAPAGGLPADNFSVRWSRTVAFSAGTYRFKVLVDDGVRLWVDDKLVIDQWHSGAPRSFTADVNLSNGPHRLRLEYFEERYDAQVRLDWERRDSYPEWKAEYFDNRKLKGDPVVVRNEADIDHNWGSSAPVSGLPADNFSARWSRTTDFQAGTYRFRATVDDGIRVWVDDTLLIDDWQDGDSRTLEAERQLSQGSHRLKIEYYERGGQARIEIAWQKIDTQSNQPPQANPGGPYTVDEGGFLLFDGRGSQDRDGNIVTYEWNFDYRNGVFNVDATGPTVTRPFAEGPASATVALRVTDNKGASHIATTSVTVRNVAPLVEAGGPYSGLLETPLSFAGTATDPSSADQTGLTYHWDFGDGSTATGPVVSHRYIKAGTYSVSLTVTDKDGGQGSDAATVTVSVVKRPPAALLTGPDEAEVAEIVTFDGRGSSDNDGTIVSYAWDFGDGTVTEGSEATVSHSYSLAGTYSVSLVVTDNSGLSATARRIIQVVVPVNLPPEPSLEGPLTGQEGEVLTFSGSESHDPDGEIVGYAWDFGDGTVTKGSEATVSHSYSTAGIYRVSLVVTDDAGATANIWREVQIDAPANQPPTAVVSGPVQAPLGQSITLEGTGSADPDGQVVSYAWDLGDSTVLSGQVISHTYTLTGTYAITLTVTDDGGLTHQAGHTVQIEPPAAGGESTTKENS